MKAVPISVNMIVKDCATDLYRCLNSLQNFLREGDEIIVVDTGSSDDTVRVAQDFGATVLDGSHLRVDICPAVEKWFPEMVGKLTHPMFTKGCLMDFAEARNIALRASKHDAIFWVDSDDEFVEREPGKFRAMIDANWDKVDEFYLDYDYSFDSDDKKVSTILRRERVVDKRNFAWMGRCHETLIPLPGAKRRNPAYVADRGCVITHTGHRHDHQISDIRNYVILRTELETDKVYGKQHDVRTLFYLGNAARGLQRVQEARGLYDETVRLSGSVEDRYAACYYNAIMFASPEVGRPRTAADYCIRCIDIKPSDPRSYFLLARCFLMMERWNEAYFWYKVGRLLPYPETLHSIDPEHVTSLPEMTALQATHELGANQEAVRHLEEIKKTRPNHPAIPIMEATVRNWLAEEDLIKAVETVFRNTPEVQENRINTTGQAREKMSEILELVKFVPLKLEDRGAGRLETAEVRPVAAKNDVAIWCGHTAEPWGPENAKTGFGGSEKMVLCMAPRLQARGFNVTVYCSCPPLQRGLDQSTGVVWRHWSEFDMNRPRDTVIFWRNVAALDMPIPAKKRIVWCHDVQRSDEWNPTRCALVDEVWLLTRAHIETLSPEVRAQLGCKIVQTRNGLDRQLFERTLAKTAGQRKRNRILYCSSPDRGVLTAINAFKAAFKDDPTAELHIGYGFTKAYWHIAAHGGYLHMCDLNRAASCDDYYRMVMAAVDSDPRIVFHGRLNWEQLAELQCTSGVWVYPTRFYEISCMAAMEAQAAGCAIVATDYAALKETISWGVPGTYNTVLETCADALKVAADTDFPRENLSQSALNRFDFEALADDWANRISV